MIAVTFEHDLIFIMIPVVGSIPVRANSMVQW